MSTLLSTEAGDIQATPLSSSALPSLFPCPWRQGGCQTAASTFTSQFSCNAGLPRGTAPWVVAQHPLSRHTPMPGHQHKKGRGTPSLCSPGRGFREIHQEVSPENRIYFFLKEESHRGSLARHKLTLGFLLPKECLGDFSKQSLCRIWGTQLWSHHTAAGRELLRRVALHRGQGRGLVSTGHMLQAEQLPWADRSHSRPS